jgi:hypothetical protein
MKKSLLLIAVLTLAVPLLAAPETWKDVALIDTHCEPKMKADPDSHPRSCLLMCAKNGFGILTADGKYLKLDDAGNQKALAALKASKKTDHIRATVTGERDGDMIKVQSLTLN